MKWSPVKIFVLNVDTFTLLVELHKSGHILAETIFSCSLTTRYFGKITKLSSKQELILHSLSDYRQNSGVKDYSFYEIFLSVET